LVALSDVSGSMHGTPMVVSIALGILVSEMSNPAFKNRVLTFEDDPRWHQLPEGASIVEKVNILAEAPWGGSTDLEKALDRIIDVCKAEMLSPEDIPDMIIFSDMQFDEADRLKLGESRQTQHERIQRKFHDLGMSICGQPYPAPRMIYWNLRANTVGYPVQSDSPNVQLLSGYSPALLKAVLLGGEESEEEVTTEEVLEDGSVVVKKEKKEVTPLETLRKILDDARYDDVRALVVESAELHEFGL